MYVLPLNHTHLKTERWQILCNVYFTTKKGGIALNDLKLQNLEDAFSTVSIISDYTLLYEKCRVQSLSKIF